MNAIYICIFNKENYVKMFYLLLESILSYGNLDDKTHILIYTSTPYMNMIKQSPLYTDKITFEINDTYNTIEKACKARLDLFNLASTKNYVNILYLDTDIIVKGDINKVFDVIQDDILYVLEEGVITNDLWGASLFESEINKYDDKSAFTSGILLFRNCEKVRNLFDKINDDTIKRYRYFECHDQPYIVYNAFKYNMYDNKVLKKYVVNNDDNVHSNKIIHHFPGGPGVYGHKIVNMTKFLFGLKKCNSPNTFINKVISNNLTLVSKERLQNLYDKCNSFKGTSYSFVECGVAKGGCLSMMKFASGPNNKIFGFDSFEGMPPITDEDLGDYNKSCPLKDFGKIGDNLSGGIENVYRTFDILNLSMGNVSLIKGFFQDTLNIQENIDKIGDIAVLRLDGDWYDSTKVCLEKLYDKVVEGGVIIIDDYGHFIGAKRATDEFRQKHSINSPLIKTDYTEHYWIKNTKLDSIKTLNIDDDVWTCSDKFRYDVFDFFKDKTEFKIAEIGAHKGYTTKVLAKIFSKVYSVDNDDKFINFSKEFNKDSTNIEYVKLDIYKDSWDVLPEDIEVSFIDAGHSYEHCKSDTLNSINRFAKLQYIIFDDYGVWPGVKQIVDELLRSKTLIFEIFIGITDVPGPNGIVSNVNEGIICKVNKPIKNIENKTYTWEDSNITFLPEFKMNAFGNGSYITKDNLNIIAEFGGRIHNIKFSEDYKNFISIRTDDFQEVKGSLI